MKTKNTSSARLAYGLKKMYPRLLFLLTTFSNRTGEGFVLVCLALRWWGFLVEELLCSRSRDCPSPPRVPLFAPTRSQSCQTYAGLSAEPERTPFKFNQAIAALRPRCERHAIKYSLIVIRTWNSHWPESVTLMSRSAASCHQRTQRAPAPLWKTHICAVRTLQYL